MQVSRTGSLAGALILLLTGSAMIARAQRSNCLPPVQLPTVTEPNIFPGEKEVWLGDAFAEQVQSDYRLIEDPQLTAYLVHIGEKLVKHLPLNDLKFRFFLIDLPDANAFVMPGGRIYVSRKLVTVAQSEDELAGVISHELGHLVTHESAIEWTRIFRNVLGITEVKDRKDVFERYNQILDNLELKAGKFKRRDREEDGQMAADQAGFYALVSAEYDPSALSRFWDRFTENNGKTGNWVSDLFGTTRPEAKRLREMLKQLNALPGECRTTRTASENSEYLAWQTRVIAAGPMTRESSLRGVISHQRLTPTLQGDISWIRFSPNGAFILAQDDSGITVLTREPFEPSFRIPTSNAYEAHFTPDSQFVIVPTANLRVERWSVDEKRLVEAREVFVLKGCLQTELSPDGAFLACLNTHFDLQMIEVATGKTVFQKKEFYQPTYWEWWRIYNAVENADTANGDFNLHLINQGFSPDGRFFVAAFNGFNEWSSWGDQVQTLDMTTLTKVGVPDSLKRMLAGGFTFLDNFRVAAVYPGDEKKSGVVSFPDGKMLTPVPLWRWRISAVTKGDFLLIRPIKDYALGVLDIKAQKYTKVSEREALDIYGDIYVSELRSGQLGLYRWNEPIASVFLPDSNLGRLSAGVMSSDMQWLAISGHSRGGLWNIASGKQALSLRGFTGAHFDAGNNFYADFPEQETVPRNIARFDSATGEVTSGNKIEGKNALQIGPYLTRMRSVKEKKDEETWQSLERDVIFEVRDSTSQNLLWSKAFPQERPAVWMGRKTGTAAMVWDVRSDAAKKLIKADPRLSAQLAGLNDKEGDYLVAVVEAKTGNDIGRLLIETGKGSFRVSNVLAAGDWVMVTDDQNRVLLYSLSTGQRKGRFFGKFATLSLESKTLCVENERGKLTLYDLDTMEKRDELVFSGALSMVEFSRDGKRLFVLSADHDSYVLDLTVSASAASNR